MGFDYICLAIKWLHVFLLAFMAKLMALMPLVSGKRFERFSYSRLLAFAYESLYVVGYI